MPIEILDIGVIMGSQAMFVFEDMVKRYPGAEYFYNDFKGRCTCNDPDCARRAMQGNLEHLFEDDKEKCADFFYRLHELGHQPNEDEIVDVLMKMGAVRVRAGGPPDIMTTLQDLIDNGAVKVIGWPNEDR